MKKFWKWTGITVLVLAILFGLIVALGYNMSKTGEKFLASKGATNIHYIGNANDVVYCKGSKSAIAYMVTVNDEELPVAVCVDAFGNAEMSR